MKNRFDKWSNKKYTERQRIIILIPLGIFFVIILPLILIVLPYYFDMWLNMPRLIFEPLNLIIAILFIIC